VYAGIHLYVNLPAIYAYTYTNSGSIIGYADCDNYSDSHPDSNCNPYRYSHGETFSYRETRTNAQVASHAPTTPVTSTDEKQMHRSARKSDV